MQGVVVMVTDVSLHGDSAHRGPAQLAAAARRAMERAILSSNPGLLRPCLLATAEIEGSDGLGGGAGASVGLGGVYAELDRRGARVLAGPPADDDQGGDAADGVSYDASSGSQVVYASLPASSCLGLADAIKGATSGRGQLRLRFLGWELLDGAAADAVPGGDGLGSASGGGGGGRKGKVRGRREVADPATNHAAAAAAILRAEVGMPVAAAWAEALSKGTTA